MSHLTGDDEITAALLSAQRVERFRYERVDREFNPLGWLDNVVADSGSVSYNYLAETKRTLRLTLRDDTESDFDFTSDMIRPHLDVLLTPGRPVTYALQDRFRRTETGGWGGQWVATRQPAQLAVNGLQALASSGTDPTSVSYPDVPADVDLTLTIGPNVVPSVSALGANVFVRLQAAGLTDTGYRFRVAISTAGALTLVIHRYTAGAATLLATAANVLTGLAGQPFKLRVQAIGSQLRMKAWLRSRSEPEAWTHEITDSTYLTAGVAGVTSGLYTNFRLDFGTLATAHSGPFAWIVDDLLLNPTAAVAPRWASWPLGTFLVDPGSARTAKGFTTRDVTGYDPALILQRSNPTTARYKIAAGVVITDRVEDILDRLEVPHEIDPSDKTQDVARDWEPQTNWLVITNELLASIGYGSLYFDASGVAHAESYQSPDEADATVEYRTNEVSVLTEELDKSTDLFDKPNKWVLYTSEPDKPYLRAVVRNNSDGPTSVEARGREIERIEQANEAVDQDELDRLCRRMAAEDASSYETVKFSTALMPMHGERTVIQLQHDPSGTDGKYAEMSWEMPLKAGALMTHEARRAIDLSNLEDIA